MFESNMKAWLSFVKKRKIDKGIVKKAATPIEEQANSNGELSLTVLTQFAEKAYNIEENIISNEKNKLLSVIDWWLGFKKIITPIKPTTRPFIVWILNLFLKKFKEINKVKRGIVPINVEATKLSTYNWLQLIKLKGKTFPNKAIIIMSFLLFLKSFLILIKLQKKIRIIEAIINL